jgi:NDP-sugar pyrophosphorylase family protein
LLRSDYGVLSSADDGLVLSYEEKPTWPLHVSEGVYAFSREALERIPAGERMDFPDLVNVLLANGEPVAVREHHGLWLDIGRPEDYDEAQRLIAKHPEAFGDHRRASTASPVADRETGIPDTPVRTAGRQP